MIEIMDCRGPCQTKEGDEELIDCGLAQHYDGDPEYIEAADGAEQALFELPLYRVRDAWRAYKEEPKVATLQNRNDPQITSNGRSGTNHTEIE